METLGQVASYDVSDGTGWIRTEAGGRFEFGRADWLPKDCSPERGVAVVFVAEGERATRILVAPAPPDRFAKIKDHVAIYSAVLGLFTASLGFILANMFVVFPNMEPVTSRSVTVSAVSVEPGVTFGDYLRHTTRRLQPEATESCVRRIRDALATPAASQAQPSPASQPTAPLTRILDADPGMSLHFTFTASGFRGECVVAESVVFDGTTGRRVRNDTVFVEQPWETLLRDADTASGELWIPELMTANLSSVVARVELYSFSSQKIQRLIYGDSVKICLPAGLPCEPLATE